MRHSKSESRSAALRSSGKRGGRFFFVNCFTRHVQSCSDLSACEGHTLQPKKKRLELNLRLSLCFRCETEQTDDGMPSCDIHRVRRHRVPATIIHTARMLDRFHAETGIAANQPNKKSSPSQSELKKNQPRGTTTENESNRLHRLSGRRSNTIKPP